MKPTDIKNLLNKYFEGETSLEEEKLLRKYFNSDQVAPELQSYVHHFQFFSDLKSEKPAGMPEDQKLFTRIQESTPKIQKFSKEKQHIWLKFAAGLALLLLGFAAGVMMDNFKPNQQVASNLQRNAPSEADILFTANLTKTSASERILAVNEARDMKNIDDEVIAALIRTMNYDDNVNVRLAAVEALSNFTDIKVVRQAIIHSLDIQDNAMVQIALIDMLVKLREKKAVNEMQKLLIDENTQDVVKQRAQQGIALLM